MAQGCPAIECPGGVVVEVFECPACNDPCGCPCSCWTCGSGGAVSSGGTSGLPGIGGVLSLGGVFGRGGAGGVSSFGGSSGTHGSHGAVSSGGSTGTCTGQAPLNHRPSSCSAHRNAALERQTNPLPGITVVPPTPNARAGSTAAVFPGKA